MNNSSLYNDILQAVNHLNLSLDNSLPNNNGHTGTNLSEDHSRFINFKSSLPCTDMHLIRKRHSSGSSPISTPPSEGSCSSDLISTFRCSTISNYYCSMESHDLKFWSNTNNSSSSIQTSHAMMIPTYSEQNESRFDLISNNGNSLKTKINDVHGGDQCFVEYSSSSSAIEIGVSANDFMDLDEKEFEDKESSELDSLKINCHLDKSKLDFRILVIGLFLYFR